MSKNVKVKFTGGIGFSGAMVLRDCTVGKIYDAILPDKGDIDSYGEVVAAADEVWLTDDVGDPVVARLSHGLEIVAEH